MALGYWLDGSRDVARKVEVKAALEPKAQRRRTRILIQRERGPRVGWPR